VNTRAGGKKINPGGKNSMKALQASTVSAGFLLAALTAFVLYRLFIYLRDFEILLNAH
jgi:hypothetical protein